MLPEIQSELDELKRRNLYRDLSRPRGIDFTSNDYLGLSTHPALRAAARQAADQFPVGAGASRLLRGHTECHAALEQFAARSFGSERALFFSSGYMANLALFSTLLKRQDAVVFDENIHASMKEGIYASGAMRFGARHNDQEEFRRQLLEARKAGARRLLIAIESVYSMDGDIAPVDDLFQLAANFDAMLVVDEAHATGVFGSRGRGCAEHLPQEQIITLHTCGKALGVAGALVCAPAPIAEYLINRARPFIYSTAAPPVIAATVLRALRLIDEENWRRERLHRLAHVAHHALCADEPFRGTPIIPIVLRDAARTVLVSAALQREGFDVRAVRPPTVAEGTARLRISIHADHSEADIMALASALHRAINVA